jgi:peptidoglycan/LPS O-acetylase OafA/YrhL
VAGPFLTSVRLISYFTDVHTWLYPAAVMVEFAKASPPPHIFSGAAFSEAINNPLWTIKYEIMAYVGLAMLYRAGVLHKTPVLLMTLGFVLAMLVILGPAPDDGPGSFNHAARYGFCFLLGVFAYHFRDRIPVSPWLLIVSAALAYMCAETRFEGAAYMTLAGHLVLVAGARDYGVLTSFCRKIDLSYGVYIYGWPVQQSLVALVPGIGVASLMVLALAIVPIFAAASWHWIEKPALRLKRLETRWLLSRLRLAS